MGLKEKYDAWQFRPILAGDNKTPRNQKDGTVAVDFLPNTYQTGVANRTPGDKTVTQATDDDKTNGEFTPTAFSRYTTLFQSSARVFKSKIVHAYNAQGTNDNDKYTTSTGIKEAPGTLYINNP